MSITSELDVSSVQLVGLDLARPLPRRIGGHVLQPSVRCCQKKNKKKPPTPCSPPTLTESATPPFNPAVGGGGSTSPPAPFFGPSCGQIGATQVTVTFNQAVTNVVISSGLGGPGTFESSVLGFSDFCVLCDALAPTGTLNVTTSGSGAPTITIAPSPPGPFTRDHQFRFSITAESADAPGCPATFGPFCFGTKFGT